ncbi:hypothetical protein F2P81_015392 [Scophthalmus maximus]|uniref:Uncharacterized protein n=1 Tax=Scophthalmus maximus TaxID=52904 RepID=A0A6A4SS80_SCOMX|nr:hypothetical protein F2P81_015392 [Scophthalmus maximus]
MLKPPSAIAESVDVETIVGVDGEEVEHRGDACETTGRETIHEAVDWCVLLFLFPRFAAITVTADFPGGGPCSLRVSTGPATTLRGTKSNTPALEPGDELEDDDDDDDRSLVFTNAYLEACASFSFFIEHTYLRPPPFCGVRRRHHRHWHLLNGTPRLPINVQLH